MTYLLIQWADGRVTADLPATGLKLAAPLLATAVRQASL